MADSCSWCRHSRFQGFAVLCTVTDELMEPQEAACQEYVEKDFKPTGLQAINLPEDS
jgi:hypothetical protein